MGVVAEADAVEETGGDVELGTPAVGFVADVKSGHLSLG